MSNNKPSTNILKTSNVNSKILLKFPKLEVGKSKIIKRGFYAGENIKKGGKICPLIGILYRMNDQSMNNFEHSFQVMDNFAIEPVNESKFINHSCNPNAFINKDWIFEALRNIKKGEEITIDYGTVDYDYYEFKCHCKSENCRKVLDGHISARKSFIKKHGKYYSPYLKNRFILRKNGKK